MKRILLILFCLVSVVGFSQGYLPPKHIAVNDAISPAQAVPIDGRMMYYDTLNFRWRDFQSTSEVLTTLANPTYRFGHSFISVHSGGTLSLGVWIGGISNLYWFKNGVGDSNLVRIYTDSVIVPKTIAYLKKLTDSTFYGARTDSTRDTILIRGTSGGGISSLSLTTPTSLFVSPVTFTNTGGAWSGTLSTVNQSAGTFFAAPPTGGLGQPSFRSMVVSDLPTGIPNGNLANSIITLSQDNTGTAPGWATTSVSLGGTALYHNPFATATTSGYLLASDWVRFNSAVTASVISVNGQTGVVVTRNADSLMGYPIDFTNFHAGWVLSVSSDSTKLVFDAPGSGSGITNLNGLGATTQTFALGYSGTSPNILSSGSVHTFNNPLVSGADTGIVTPALYNLWNSKQTALSGTGYLTFSGSTPSYLTSTQVTANLNLFTNLLQGLVPASGGGTINFMRADGSWAAPIGGSPNSNIGSGFRLAVPNTNNIKTFFCVGCTLDSITNANALTLTVASGASSVSNSDGTLTISPTSGAVVASLNLGHANTWSALQTFGTLTTTGATKFTGISSGSPNDSIMTINPSTGMITWRTGQPYPIYPVQGLSPIGTHGDSLALGGLLGTLFQPDTLFLAFNHFYMVNMLGKSTVAGTDSVLIKTASGELMGVPTSAIGGGGGTPGNPTAVVGLTAVNGSATTYMRSDAAPPIDQTITPTWTGGHTFNAATVFGANISFSSSTLQVGDATHAIQKVWSQNYQSPGGIVFASATGNGLAMQINGVPKFTELSTGQMQFNGYTTSTSFTGTPVAILATDASGNIIQTSLVGGGVTTDSVQYDTTSVNTTVTQAPGANHLVVNPSSVISSLTITTATSFHNSNDLFIDFGGSSISSGTVVTAVFVNAGSGLTIIESTNPNGSTFSAGDYLWYHKVGSILYRKH